MRAIVALFSFHFNVKSHNFKYQTVLHLKSCKYKEPLQQSSDIKSRDCRKFFIFLIFCHFPYVPVKKPLARDARITSLY